MKPAQKLAISAAAFLFASAAYAQNVETPFTPLETGLTDPPEASGPAVPGQGGTLAPELGGAVQIDAGSASALPMTPDSDPEYNRNGD